MDRIKINMLSSADKIKGQGVGSAYLEQVRLIKDSANKMFDVSINGHGEFDIYHIHTIGLINYVRMKLSKVPCVCYVHFLPDTLDGSISLPRLLFKIFKRYVINFYKSADHLIVVNPIFIDSLANYGIAKERITYIPNYVSKEQFFCKDKQVMEAIKDSYNIANDAFVVVGVGQVQTRKGVSDFVEVAKQLPNITFVWCGGFSFGQMSDGYHELKQMVEHPPKNVTFTGILPRDNMNDIYNIADVLFMPSYNELFPMAILEAVNLYKPLLLRDLPLYEGILFQHYLAATDNDGFVALLSKLQEDHDFYEQSQQDSKAISTYYSKENILTIWINFYTKILNEFPKKGEM